MVSNKGPEMENLSQKGKNRKKMTANVILAVSVIVIIVLGWKNFTTYKIVFENFLMGTYQKNLSEEELARKRTLRLGHDIKLVAPQGWTIMKDFPKKGHLFFDLDSAGVDGTIHLQLENGQTHQNLTDVNQKEVIFAVHKYLSTISTLAKKDVTLDGVVRSLKGHNWKRVQSTDETKLGKRHTGIYYTVTGGQVVILYFFSMEVTSEPIVTSVEKLIKRMEF